MSNSVIDNIRRSLGRTAQISSPQGTPLGPRPAIYQSRQAGTTDSEIQLFLDEIKKLSGVGQRLAPSGIAEALKTLVAENNIHRATVWDTPHLQQLQIIEHLAALDVELVSPTADTLTGTRKHEMALCDLGITEADFLLPETGTIVLHSSAEMPRAVSLLPRIHLAIVRPEMLRPDMHQVFAEGKDNNYLVFITGPSRTADIELTTTLGVHGPKELFVWIVEDKQPK
jgi:L-lactate dehydrogenase complex protein LldG